MKVRKYEPSFIPDPDFSRIRSTILSRNEALVYFAVTSVGSLALIVCSDDEPVIPVWLNRLTEEKLIEYLHGPGENPESSSYRGVFNRWRSNPHDSEARIAWFDILDSTTNRFWDWLMGPLTEKLVESGISRAALIPQGWLGLLPLHAAWTVENGMRRYALDDVCYTYAPNALSLAACRENAIWVQSERILAIEEPHVENAGNLPYSNAEVTSICRRFFRKTVLADEIAVRTTVMDALPCHDVLHFSCHGMADFDEPLNSGLLVANGQTLTLRDFLSTAGIYARLAVLSACETGIPDLNNADEVIGLPAGLIQAGVAGVTASLWPVNDLSTMVLMIRFYEFWRRDNFEPPEALRQAQIWMRDATNSQKAEYFGGFLPEFGKRDNQGLPVHLADMLCKAFLSDRPDENDFQHPFYWAAFTYTGV